MYLNMENLAAHIMFHLYYFYLGNKRNHTTVSSTVKDLIEHGWNQVENGVELLPGDIATRSR